jgi:hypothetical protein
MFHREVLGVYTGKLRCCRARADANIRFLCRIGVNLLYCNVFITLGGCGYPPAIGSGRSWFRRGGRRSRSRTSRGFRIKGTSSQGENAQEQGTTSHGKSYFTLSHIVIEMKGPGLYGV